MNGRIEVQAGERRGHGELIVYGCGLSMDIHYEVDNA
jgi:hypothetical protein